LPVTAKPRGTPKAVIKVVGEQQARALGERLAGVAIDRAVASPLIRAETTAKLALGAARADMLTTDAGLMEIAHGEWEGLLASDIAARTPELLRQWRDAPETVQMPGGESLGEVFARAWPAFTRACQDTPKGGSLLVVAHDAVNRVILCHILGIPFSRLWSFRQAPTTLNLLEGADVAQLEVVRLNDCAHHTALFGEAIHRAL